MAGQITSNLPQQARLEEKAWNIAHPGLFAPAFAVPPLRDGPSEPPLNLS
jgi:hypothetical protein